jgi:hypothetical protein
MSQNDRENRKTGRPTKSAEGKRVVVHLSLSPEAHRALRALCQREIAPIPDSSMVEHLVLEAAKGRGRASD